MSTEPTRPEIDSTPGLLVLEFGARWCPICQAARGLIDAALAGSTDVTHLWVEDGKGKPLGRSFNVKLWPTLVFLRDGKEVARVIRPREPGELDAALRVLR